MPEPILIDVFTLSESGQRANIFSQGERIEFFLIHSLSEDGAIGTPYKATFILDHYLNTEVVVDAAHAHGLVFRPDEYPMLFNIRRLFTYDGTYASRNRGTYFRRYIPEEQVFEGPRYDTVAQVISYLSEDLNFALSQPGLWRLKGMVELTEASTGRPFSVFGDWHYKIIES